MEQRTSVVEPIEVKFNRLVAEWRHNTRYGSALRKIVMDPSYQEIIAIGKPVLPLIFRELEANGGHWFWALQDITNDHVGNPEDDFETARHAWLNWGREHGYLCN